jgi:hypothetical protein
MTPLDTLSGIANIAVQSHKKTVCCDVVVETIGITASLANASSWPHGPYTNHLNQNKPLFVFQYIIYLTI